MKDYAVEILKAIVVVAGGGAGIWAIIKQLASAAKTRAEAKKISEESHRETHKLLHEQLAAEQETARTATALSLALQAENEELRKRNAALENKNERLTVALAQRDTDKKKNP